MNFRIRGLFLSFIILSCCGCYSSNKNNQINEISTNGLYNGAVDLSNKKFNNLSVNGSANLDEVSVIDKIIINGSLSAEASNFKILEVNGSIIIKKSTVAGQTNINGSLIGDQSTFDTISAKSDHIIFKDSKIKNITFDKTSNFSKKQTLELVNTEIKGDIVFENGKGEVLLKDGSKIEGKVLGAVIKK